MNKSDEQANLELKVTDFGPIAKAEIDLRPLTVFAGPSNTGKSYLAILIYALQQYFSDIALSRRRPSFSSYRKYWRRPSQEVTDALIGMVRRRTANPADLTVRDGITLPAPVLDYIRSGLDQQGDEIDNEIVRSFGIDEIGSLVRKGSSEEARVVIRRYISKNPGPIEQRIVFKTQGIDFSTMINLRKEIEIDSRVGGYLDGVVADLEWADDRTRDDRFFGWLMRTVAHFTLRRVVDPLHLPVFYLPADRTGVMHAHTAVVSAMFQNAPMTGLRPAARTPMLSGVLADFLRQLLELDQPHQKRRKPRRDLGKQIEKAILGGAVNVERSELTGYPSFTYRPNGWKDTLPLMNASSMVSELAPVVLYLRHLVGSDSVLIIEEPESHLHPAMQVEFTRQLAAMVRSGVRVIVTTHSEWVLEELANIVRRSALPETHRTSDAEVALRPRDVGAWLFKPEPSPKGSIVEEVILDEETGLYPTDYDVVSEALYNENVKIFNRIQDSRAK